MVSRKNAPDYVETHHIAIPVATDRGHVVCGELKSEDWDQRRIRPRTSGGALPVCATEMAV